MFSLIFTTIAQISNTSMHATPDTPEELIRLYSLSLTYHCWLRL